MDMQKLEYVSMFWIRRKRRHQEEIRVLKQDIGKELDKARKATQANKTILESNGITLEIKKAVGGRHG